MVPPVPHGWQGPGTSTHPTAGRGESEDLAPGLRHTPCAAVGARVMLALKGFEDGNTIVQGEKIDPWFCLVV